MKPEKTLLEQLRGPKVIDMARGTERSASDLELRAANEIERLETALSEVTQRAEQWEHQARQQARHAKAQMEYAGKRAAMVREACAALLWIAELSEPRATPTQRQVHTKATDCLGRLVELETEAKSENEIVQSRSREVSVPASLISRLIDMHQDAADALVDVHGDPHRKIVEELRALQSENEKGNAMLHDVGDTPPATTTTKPTLQNGPGIGNVPTFEEAWAKKEAEGYHYGHDALEQVRFGWEIRDSYAAPSLRTSRSALLLALVAGGHSITDGEVTFYYDPKTPGNNALDQLVTRLEACCNCTSQSQSGEQT